VVNFYSRQLHIVITPDVAALLDLGMVGACMFDFHEVIFRFRAYTKSEGLRLDGFWKFCSHPSQVNRETSPGYPAPIIIKPTAQDIARAFEGVNAGLEQTALRAFINAEDLGAVMLDVLISMEIKGRFRELVTELDDAHRARQEKEKQAELEAQFANRRLTALAAKVASLDANLFAVATTVNDLHAHARATSSGFAAWLSRRLSRMFAVETRSPTYASPVRDPA
jgi:hypothetical protein